MQSSDFESLNPPDSPNFSIYTVTFKDKSHLSAAAKTSSTFESKSEIPLTQDQQELALTIHKTTGLNPPNAVLAVRIHSVSNRRFRNNEHSISLGSHNSSTGITQLTHHLRFSPSAPDSAPDYPIDSDESGEKKK